MSPSPPDLDAIGADVQWPDHDAETAAGRIVDGTPGMGRLAELARWLGGAGIGPDAAAAQRVRLIAPGATGARPAALADEVGAGVHELSVPAEPDAALTAGIAAADEAVDSGTRLLLAACPGEREPAAAMISALTGAEPVTLLQRGAAATEPAAWMERAAAVRDLRRRLVPLRAQPAALLRAAASPRIAALCGLVLQAAVRRTPVLLDGTAAAAAALVAFEVQPRAVRWWAAADTTEDPAADRAHRQLGLVPLLAFRTSGGDGTAALLCLPALRAATELAIDRTAA